MLLVLVEVELLPMVGVEAKVREDVVEINSTVEQKEMMLVESKEKETRYLERKEK